LGQLTRTKRAFFREQYFQNALRFSGFSTSKMRERPENHALIAGERYTILEVLNPENRTLIAGERSTLTLAQFHLF
jgi:hypothetical protein